MYAMERSEMYAALIYHTHIYLSKGKYYLNLSDTFYISNHKGQIFSECTIGNVRHIGLATCRTFPIVQSEKI